MVGILVSFWDGLSSGPILALGSVLTDARSEKIDDFRWWDVLCNMVLITNLTSTGSKFPLRNIILLPFGRGDMFLQKGWTFVHCCFFSGDFPMTLRDAARISSEITSLREASAVLEDSPRGGAKGLDIWEFLFGAYHLLMVQKPQGSAPGRNLVGKIHGISKLPTSTDFSPEFRISSMKATKISSPRLEKVGIFSKTRCYPWTVSFSWIQMMSLWTVGIGSFFF